MLRRVFLLLAALTTLALVSVSSALAASGPQTRVRAFNEPASTLIRVGALQSACSRPGSLAPAARIASGFCVATEGEGAGRTVFSGPDGIDAGDESTATVPEGTSLNFYTEHGGTISDSTGNLIETGPAPVPTETFGPGSQVPDYWLEPPDGLTIQGNPFTVSEPTRLSDLLQEGMGPCDWAACRSVG